MAFGFLGLGVFLMLGPVLWLVLSSFKTEAALQEYPPKFLPLAPIERMVDGYDQPLQMYTVTAGEHAGRELAQVRRIGLNAQMVDPANPSERLNVAISDREPLREFGIATENYTGVFERFQFHAVFLEFHLHYGDSHRADSAVQFHGCLCAGEIQVHRA